ncbi:TerB N-terminal domain-containing protein [Jiella mangrovi]|uniref:TerB N-terminal domain-containing protein n=1 Tax=Jiella mangrovi TaxID=2821407 RepID=A0ABS4BG76_9HYPH|nr:TerB N-terminal domain-containing protein [Jiella mangrovi]MBP0615753.1 TerB N-terminal domain-containing protein [Jiella mangrovi]
MEALIGLLILVGTAWVISRAIKEGRARRKSRSEARRKKRSADSSSPAKRSNQTKSPPSRQRTSNGPAFSPSSMSITAPARKALTVPKTRWIQPGETISISRHLITSGMIFVGERGSSGQFRQFDNCVIDPSLSISKSTSDKAGASMPYWPAYSEIGPDQRRAYVDWLAEGRNDPEVGIGYVFLFFYGLERRLFHDLVVEEASAFVTEVRRLLHIYGSNNSFKNYARRFIDTAEAVTGDLDRFHIEPSLDLGGYDMPLTVRLYLGRCLQRGTPLTEDEALVWVLSHPETQLRTPARRCFDELRALWRHRFSAQYPTGFNVKLPKARLRLQYRPASSSFECDLPIGNDEIPDVLALKARTTRLQDLLEACTSQLDTYSRFIGKNPASRGSLEAASSLPREIMMEAGGKRLAAIRKQLDLQFAEKAHLVMRVPRLLEALQIKVDAKAKLSAGAANQIASILDRLDVGHEPDRRHGASTPTVDGRLVLFRAIGGGGVGHDSLAFRSARTMVEIGAIAAAADGNSAPEELESVKSDLLAIPDLTSSEKERLTALAVLLLKDAPSQAPVLKRLAALPEMEKRRVTQSAISAVLADGHVSPAEVKFIEKLHKSLGYPVEHVYAALHRGTVVADELHVVAVAEPSRGLPIPAPPDEQKPAKPEISIDHARLERIRNETVAVSSLLSDIFSEDIPDEPAETPHEYQDQHQDAQVSPFAGLDEAHANLLKALVRWRRMSRKQFEACCRELKLLPDGAIETINEWGFDRFDETVLEDDGDLVVVDHLLPELQTMEDAA